MTQVQQTETEEVQRRCLEGSFEAVTCSFCGGKGKDPFGIMSWLSNCVVCGGRGEVLLPVFRRRCAHCQGTGAIKTFTCTVCRGTGQVPEFPGPVKVCAACRGTGDDASYSALACLTCRAGAGCPGSHR